MDAEEIIPLPAPALALEEEAMAKEVKKPVFRDIRRYYCEFCGICRSKKALIRSHILSHHQEDVADDKKGGMEAATEKGRNICEECGASFRKPAHLKQHMQSHSLQFETIVDLWREALDPMWRTPKCDEAFEWTSIRRGTSCEAPSRLPLSRGLME